jgi:hypothetical protein
MSNTFYIVAAYALTYVVLAGYALQLRARYRALRAAQAAGGRQP